jgi:hypothetical protein
LQSFKTLFFEADIRAAATGRNEIFQQLQPKVKHTAIPIWREFWLYELLGYLSVVSFPDLLEIRASACFAGL